jgi:hypothetical protein
MKLRITGSGLKNKRSLKPGIQNSEPGIELLKRSNFLRT